MSLRHHIGRLGAAAALALVASCGCPDELVYAVNLQIDEVSGPTADPIMVRYRVDGGAWIEIADTSGPTGTEDICPTRAQCLLGPELEGAYEIEVIRGPATARAETFVQSDRCSVHRRVVAVPLP